MNRRRLWVLSPTLLSGFGLLLFLVAVGHHATELLALDSLAGPVAALLLDGLPALALVYAGRRLAAADLLPEGRWRVCVWALAGAALFGAAMGLTLLVRSVEGRVVTEPLFPVLVAVEAGGLAGAVAGYYAARAHSDARRATTVSEALAFVNDLIRHDLRNDLTVIRGRADLLDTDGVDTEESAAVIAEKVEESMTRLETTGAVAETFSGDPDLDPVDLAAVTAETVTRTERTADIETTTALPDRALVTANAGLRSVVDNLVENAAEHNDAEDPRLWIAVTRGDETVRLTVADDGPGIPDERKATLFDAGADGTGRSGLAIVRTLVEGYGGDIRVEDRNGRRPGTDGPPDDGTGSLFVVELPRAEDA
jgi:signal transduction histidine kinase